MCTRSIGAGEWVGRCTGVFSTLSVLWGFANAFAGIALPNPGSEALHASMGFTSIGIFPRAGHKLGEWHDVGWWHRPLASSDPPREPAPPPDDQIRALLQP